MATDADELPSIHPEPPMSNGSTSLSDRLSTLPCWLDVDLDAVRANVRAIQHWVGDQTAIAGVVKAQAYGVGALEVSRAVLQSGVTFLAVARVHEGVDLRRSGLACPILVLSRTDPMEAEEVVHHRLTPTVDTPDLAAALDRAAERAGAEISVHLKVDTGLHRFGVEPRAAIGLARALSDATSLRLEGLWTHFASADAEDLGSAQQQLDQFWRVSGELEEAGYQFPIRHAANSAATLALREAHLDMVRVGQILYGVNPFDFGPPPLDLEPAVSLRARVARVMELAEGDAVGYGETWRADRPTRAATLTLGYADGLPRDLSGRGRVFIHGRCARILGRVMMDHAVVDVTDIPDVRPGTEATLFGSANEHAIDIWDVARDAGTIPHDILAGIGGRVPRVYREEGNITRIARLDGSVETDSLPS
jgi:alanine racemase